MGEYFRLQQPSELSKPIVVDVPHAGEWVPDEVWGEMTENPSVLKRDLDLYVDEIWQDAPSLGCILLASDVSRYVVDLNRACDDVTSESVVGRSAVMAPGYYRDRGVVWANTTDGIAVLREPMSEADFQRRLDRFYHPYHQALQGAIDAVVAAFGYCILVDGHSMPSMGRKQHGDTGKRRADIVPGDIDGAACASAVTRTAERHFLSHGYTVSTNQPYQGGWITRNYGRPSQGVHSLQIECNRDLYMDETTFVRKPEGLERLRCASRTLLTELAALPLG